LFIQLIKIKSVKLAICGSLSGRNLLSLHKKECMAQSDEIDLLELAVKLNKVFIKNLRSLLIAFIIGASAGLAFYQLVPNTYESKMIFTSNVLTLSLSKTLIADLERLRKENNQDELAKRLYVSIDDAAKIKSFEIESSIEKSEGLRESEKTTLAFIIKSNDPFLFSKIQSSLIKFFENNEFAKLKEKENRAYFQGMIAKTTQEISELEKMRTQFLEGTLFKNGAGNTNLFDPTEINSKIIELTKEKLKNEGELAFAGTVQVIQGFSNFKKPVSPKLSISLASGASLGLFFVLAFIGIKGFRGMVKLANKKEEQPSA
jgi:hypothetical protein